MHWIVVGQDSALNISTNEHWQATRNIHRAKISKLIRKLRGKFGYLLHHFVPKILI